jgi:hypothetical protein
MYNFIMANVHGFGNRNRNNGQEGDYQSLPEDVLRMADFVNTNKVPFIYTPQNTTPPLE